MAKDVFDGPSASSGLRGAAVSEISEAYLWGDATGHTHRLDDRQADDDLKAEWKERSCRFSPQ